MDMHKKEVILILEDYDALRNVLGRYFENHGYNVISTGSLDNALRVGNEEHPKIIVFDSHMNVRDPYKTIALLHVALPKCAIIVMNGDTEKDKEKLISLGVRSVFKRSYDRTEFEKAISNIRTGLLTSIAA